MKVIYTIVLVSTLLMTACDGDTEEEALPSIEFSKDYVLADFNFDTPVDYWELRRANVYGEDAGTFDVLVQYDIEANTQLDDTQLQLLSEYTSLTGLKSFCLPANCPVYGAVVSGSTVYGVTNIAEMIELFGRIDTEAELYLRLLYTWDYDFLSIKAVAYRPTESGYLVVLDWDNLCGLRGQDLVKVYYDGVIEKIREISSEETGYCV